MSSSVLHPRSIWSPHRDSGCVRVCKSLLGLRGEEWLWVNDPAQARWIVIDASRQVDEQCVGLVNDPHQHRYGIALAKSWLQVPGAHWAFFKLPLTPRGFFPWINQTLGLPANSHVDKELPSEEVASAPSVAPWEGQMLRLKRWPNLTAYAGASSLQLVQICRRLLVEAVAFNELKNLPNDAGLLQRLLADAWAQDNLIIAAPVVQQPEVRTAAVPRREPSLFQRFLSRFR
ncbi:hypothetical protein [Vitreoscilla filiformis]|uniref:hypothetical protein n=1 Tax=Vitreoscilla filiformis TaxID=63 RepID=UPI0012FE77EA|nr:hypothetical protein [Vitreoscilla filiformis]